MDFQTLLAIVLMSYIIGSFPTAYLVVRLVKGVNIFEYGSGNMGTTNALRTVGWFWGAIVMIGDISKGILAVVASRALAPDSVGAIAGVIGAVAVVVGHNWSLFASIISGRIRGGKGVATAGGTWLIMMPAIVIAVPLIILAVIVITTRYMSLGVLTAVSVSAAVVLLMVLASILEPVYLLYALIITAMIFLRLRENIKRLRDGNERRVGERVQIAN